MPVQLPQIAVGGPKSCLVLVFLDKLPGGRTPALDRWTWSTRRPPCCRVCLRCPPPLHCWTPAARSTFCCPARPSPCHLRSPPRHIYPTTQTATGWLSLPSSASPPRSGSLPVSPADTAAVSPCEACNWFQSEAAAALLDCTPGPISGSPGTRDSTTPSFEEGLLSRWCTPDHCCPVTHPPLRRLPSTFLRRHKYYLYFPL